MGSASYESTEVDGLPTRRFSWNKEVNSLEVHVSELCLITANGFTIMHDEALASVSDDFVPAFKSVFESVKPQSG